MVKTVTIDGKEIVLRCSGATYIKYKNMFHQDLFVELNKINQQAQDESEMPEGSIEVLLRSAYIMALQGDSTLTMSFEDWLDQFELIGSLEGIQAVFEMLNNDKATLDDAKKKNDQQIEK